MSRLWKRLKGPHRPHSIALVVLVASAILASGALIVRGAFWLRAPLDLSLSRRPAEPAGRPSPAPAQSPRQIGEQILSRNIFDSAGGSLAWERASPPSAGDAGTANDAEVAPSGARCGGDVRLLASVVRARDPKLSIAALRKDGKTHIIAVGERQGELELLAVLPTGAHFRDGSGGTCFLPVYLSANEAPLPPPPPSQPEVAPAVPEKQLTEAEALARAKRPPAFSEEELKKNIRALSPTRYAVTRELFTRARLNPSGISRGARFKPQTNEGRASGMQVFKLRDDSLLAHLGVKQGDVLRGINGFGLGSADSVLEAFGHLGKKSEVTLSIERDGALMAIQYLLE